MWNCCLSGIIFFFFCAIYIKNIYFLIYCLTNIFDNQIYGSLKSRRTNSGKSRCSSADLKSLVSQTLIRRKGCSYLKAWRTSHSETRINSLKEVSKSWIETKIIKKTIGAKAKGDRNCSIKEIIKKVTNWKATNIV